MTALMLIVMLALRIFLAPLAAEAQQPGKVSRIGVLYPGSPAAAERWLAPHLHQKQDDGWMGVAVQPPVRHSLSPGERHEQNSGQRQQCGASHDVLPV